MSESKGSDWFPVLLVVGGWVAVTAVAAWFTGGRPGPGGGDTTGSPPEPSDDSAEDLLTRKRPPSKEEVERTRAKLLLDANSKVVRADVQIELQQKAATEFSNLQRKLDDLQSQQDSLPLNALVDTVKFMAGLIPGVSTAMGFAEAIKLGSEAIALRDEADRLQQAGQVDAAAKRTKEADDKANEMLAKIGRAVVDAMPVVGDAATLVDVVAYNPRMKRVEIEALKVATEAELLEAQRKASAETLARLKEELPPDDPRLKEYEQRQEALDKSIDEQVKARSEQLQKWAEAVKKVGPFDEERPETEDMPEIADFGDAHDQTQKIAATARATLEQNDREYRDILKRDIEALKASMPPSDLPPDVDPEEAKPPERRSLAYYKKLHPTSKPSELQGFKNADIKLARAERSEKAAQKEREFEARKRSKREEILSKIEERRIEAARTREDDEQNRTLDQDTLAELIAGREQTLREMRENANTTPQDVKDVERMFNNLEREAARRDREAREELHSSSSISSEDLKLIDQEAVEDWTKQEIADFLTQGEDALKEMEADMEAGGGTTQADIDTHKEMLANIAEVGNK